MFKKHFNENVAGELELSYPRRVQSQRVREVKLFNSKRH